MTARRLLPLAMLSFVALVAAGCGGPLSIGQPLPLSGDSFAGAAIVTCLPAAGRLKVTYDSTSGANPSYVKGEINDSLTGGERFDLHSPVGAHFEGTSTISHPAGTCVSLAITPMCIQFDSDCSQFWWTGTRTFHYEVSLVP